MREGSPRPGIRGDMSNPTRRFESKLRVYGIAICAFNHLARFKFYKTILKHFHQTHFQVFDVFTLWETPHYFTFYL